MALKTSTFSCRLNKKDKFLASKFLNENDRITLSEAFEIYLREIIRVNGIPFELILKNNNFSYRKESVKMNILTNNLGNDETIYEMKDTENKVNYTVRFDPEEKEEAEKIVNELGLTLSSAFNIYLREIIRCNGLPFERRVEHYNRETREALLEDLSDKEPMSFDEFKNWCESLKEDK